MKKNLFSISVLMMAGVMTASSQDAHFSQWLNTPLTLNPAMTGVFNGKFRFSNDFRSQWSGITKAYTDIHVSADLPVAKALLRNGQFFGVGFLLMQNRSGSNFFRQTIIQGSLSYTTPIDEGDNYISIGFQGGLNQNSVNMTSSTWGSQWNGDDYDPGSGNPEIVSLEQFSFVDLSAGLFWHYVPDQYNFVYAGASVGHIGGENTSFYIKEVYNIHRRYTVNIGSDISMNDDHQSWFAPKALFLLQGKQKEITGGFSIKNKVRFKSQYTNYQKELMFSLGAYYRFADAAIVSARFEYNNLSVGLSYDYVLSSLHKNANAGSAFEITISILNPLKRGEIRRNYNKMPKFF
ncbi:MAG: PorP/SprF family type IX secretion system membrane protein [Bacteroidota bacterium]